MSKLFENLTREHAIKLRDMVANHCDEEQRREQVYTLGIFLSADGSSYGDDAAVEMLKSLVPYTKQYVWDKYQKGAPKESIKLPKCVIKAYDIMFGALDESLNKTIGYHYEIETWDDPLGEVTSSVTTYDEEEAYAEYHCLRLAGEFVRLLRVNEVKDWYDFDVLEINF